jgi:hypothetical protein
MPKTYVSVSIEFENCFFFDFLLLNSSILIKISAVLAGLYILVSLTLPIVLIVYPSIIKHIVFMNFCKIYSIC